jgi:hypothetical protein
LRKSLDEEPLQDRGKIEHATHMSPLGSALSPAGSIELASPGSRPDKIQGQLKWAFFICFIIGVVAEWFTFTAGAVVAILVYFAIGMLVSRASRNTERLGDACYYLGFLFTMWSLFFALQPWARGSESISSSYIVVQFGIALLTTLVGMSLRIFLIQNRRTVADQEEEARASIAELTDQLVTTLQRSVRAVEPLQTNLFANAEKAVAEMLSNSAKAVAEMGQSAVDSVSKILAELEHTQASAQQKSLANLDTILEDSGTKFKTRIQSAVDQFSSEIDIISDKVRQIDVPTDVIARQLSVVTNDILGGAREFRTGVNAATVDVQQSIAAIAERISQITGQLTGIRDSVGRATAMNKKLSAAYEGVSEASIQFASTMTAASQGLAQFSGSATEARSAVDGLRSALASDHAKFQTSVEDGVARVNAAVAAIDGDVRKFAGTMEETAVLLRTVLQDREPAV